MEKRGNSWRRCGLTATEVLVAALVGGAIAVPLLTLLFQERASVQYSRFRHAAVLAARDEAYEARFAVAAGVDPDSLEHDWQPLVGSPLERLGDRVSGGGLPDAVYAREQQRLQTRLEILTRTVPDSGDPVQERLQLAAVSVRWDEPEVAAEEGPAKKTRRPGSIRLVFGWLLPPEGARP